MSSIKSLSTADWAGGSGLSVRPSVQLPLHPPTHPLLLSILASEGKFQSSNPHRDDEFTDYYLLKHVHLAHQLLLSSLRLGLSST
jgi:hypothetical protein